jgi:hypothetical protein
MGFLSPDWTSPPARLLTHTLRSYELNRRSHPTRHNSHPQKYEQGSSRRATDWSAPRARTDRCRQHVSLGSRTSFRQHLRFHQRSLRRSSAFRERDGQKHGDGRFAHREQRWCGPLSDCGFARRALRGEGVEAGLSGIHAHGSTSQIWGSLTRFTPCRSVRARNTRTIWTGGKGIWSPDGRSPTSLHCSPVFH